MDVLAKDVLTNDNSSYNLRMLIGDEKIGGKTISDLTKSSVCHFRL